MFMYRDKVQNGRKIKIPNISRTRRAGRKLKADLKSAKKTGLEKVI